MGSAHASGPRLGVFFRSHGSCRSWRNAVGCLSGRTQARRRTIPAAVSPGEVGSDSLACDGSMEQRRLQGFGRCGTDLLLSTFEVGRPWEMPDGCGLRSPGRWPIARRLLPKSSGRPFSPSFRTTRNPGRARWRDRAWILTRWSTASLAEGTGLLCSWRS